VMLIVWHATNMFIHSQLTVLMVIVT
jgi:hypothetical protein